MGVCDGQQPGDHTCRFPGAQARQRGSTEAAGTSGSTLGKIQVMSSRVATVYIQDATRAQIRKRLIEDCCDGPGALAI